MRSGALNLRRRSQMSTMLDVKGIYNRAISQLVTTHMRLNQNPIHQLFSGAFSRPCH